MDLRESTGSGVWSSRSPMRLGARLEKALSGYAGAAVAAGVSLLALSPPAGARIVHTPANTLIPANGGPVLLDLNHDGIADFSFSNRFSSLDDGSESSLRVSPKVQGNKIWGRGSLSGSFGGKPLKFASALRAGFEVGPNKPYFQKGNPGLMVWGGFSHYKTETYGQWLYTRHRYLGFQFAIDGKVHYGWARVSVTYVRPTLREHGIYATLTGYAYETIPNKPIITGKTSGPDVITLDPATLGHLAQGASGIPTWREKK